MLQYKIPQNVGIEDKIVGPLSLRQLIIIAVGGGISYVLFALLNKLYELNILEYIVIVIPALISVAAALIKINDITFTRFLLLALEFAIKPKKRIWDHRGIAPLVAPDIFDLKPQESQASKEEKEKKPVNLDELSRILDSGGLKDVKAAGSEDMDKAGDEDLVTQAFFGKKKSETDNMYFRANKYETAKKRLDILAKLPRTEPKKEEVKKEETVKMPAPEIKPAPKPTPPPASGPTIKPAPKPQQQQPVQAPKPAAQVFSPPRPVKQRAENRPRQKPPKKRPKPVPQRQDTQINTTQRQKPIQFVPQPQKKPEPPARPKPIIPVSKTPPIPAPPPKKPMSSTGEIRMEELKKGEIEINLD
ncbi:PrgI family protein [Candidatus Peregrinibacteria bacterium]|nr:PrgI family protein [Candidatus Peregrinibacteria bacterium]